MGRPGMPFASKQPVHLGRTRLGSRAPWKRNLDFSSRSDNCWHAFCIKMEALITGR
jgi:hypothetical protein